MFITLLSGVAGWPLAVAALAQQTAKPVIGFLGPTTPGAFPHILAAFHQGLKEACYVEGLKAAVEYQWGEGQYDRLPALAIELSLEELP